MRIDQHDERWVKEMTPDAFTRARFEVPTDPARMICWHMLCCSACHRLADSELDNVAYRTGQVLVSWEHQRWTWHTTTPMNASSHVVFYGELEEDAAGLIGMAAFMGLVCSPASALRVWEAHEKATIRMDYNMYGLQQETIEWMNATMARLLPVPLALKWEITSTEV